MSRIDDLIAELAPKGVEFKSLGELLGNIPRGRRLTKSNLAVDGAIPVYHGGLDPIGFHDRANTPGETVMIINTGASSGTVGWSEVPFWCSDGCFALPHSESFLARFLYYYASAHHRFFVDRVRRAGIPTLAADAVLSMRVPVPPLEVQREIVRVLDQFTQLEAELEAELEARRRQYEYYRAVLLSSSDDAGVRDVSLGEIIRLNFGARITKKDNAGTIYPVYGGGGESFRTNAFNREDEWVISRFAMSANCVRRVAGKFWMLDSGFTFDVTDASVDKDFVGQLLLSMQPTIFATSTQSAQKNIDVDGFKRLRVQVPSLETQRRVALALASFDGIVNDLSSGLPAELNARRKQYEYYRDKLLTFEEAAV